MGGCLHWRAETISPRITCLSGDCYRDRLPRVCPGSCWASRPCLYPCSHLLEFTFFLLQKHDACNLSSVSGRFVPILALVSIVVASWIVGRAILFFSAFYFGNHFCCSPLNIVVLCLEKLGQCWYGFIFAVDQGLIKGSCMVFIFRAMKCNCNPVVD